MEESTETDVFSSRNVADETQLKGKQLRAPTEIAKGASVGSDDTGQEAEKGTFPCAVSSYDSNCFTSKNLHRDILERPEESSFAWPD